MIPDGWENILSVGIKTSKSVLLPVWSAKLDGRFGVGKGEADVDVEMDVREEGKKGKGKGKKRALELDGAKTKAEKAVEPEKTVTREVEEAPKVKKPKTVDGKVAVKSVDGKSKAERIGKKEGKKSNMVGSGAKRVKEGVLGKGRK